MNTIDNSAVSTHLGKSSIYADKYDPSLLVREPRQSNRKHLGIDDNNLPFVGSDTWNAYEITALTYDGLPVTGIAKIVYPASNKFIVESKSLKLYLNSFNMSKAGNHAAHVRQRMEYLIEGDLSNLLETSVDVKIYSNRESLETVTNPSTEWNNDFYTLEDKLDMMHVKIVNYTENPDLIELIIPDEYHSVLTAKYHSSLLKSNCRVTKQPDHGDVFIKIKGKNGVCPLSLLKYIISFRDECHFHEEICETIYKRLWDIAMPDELMVMCLYTRRGGIDICPIRASHKHLLHSSLIESTIQHVKTPRQ